MIGIKDLDQLILSRIPDKQLLTICQINKRFYYHVCDDDFLKRRLSKYPNIEKYREENWKRFFLNVIHTIPMMKEKFDFKYTEGNFKIQNTLLKIHRNRYDLLFDACIEGEISLVHHMLRRGGSADKINIALNLASVNGHLNIVKYFIRMGAHIHFKQDKALRSACSNGHLQIVQFLVENGADIHAKNDYALKAAIREGHFRIVEYLSPN